MKGRLTVLRSSGVPAFRGALVGYAPREPEPGRRFALVYGDDGLVRTSVVSRVWLDVGTWEFETESGSVYRVEVVA